MRSAEAHAALRRFCEDALAHVRQSVPGSDGLPRVWVPTFQFSGAGGTGSGEWKVNWRRVVGDHVESLRSIAAYGAAIDVLEANQWLRGTGVWAEQPMQTIIGLLLRLVDEQQGLEFDASVFDLLYHDTEDYFYQSTVRYRHLAPLQHFRMESDKIELDECMSIVRIPDQLRSEMLFGSMEGPPQLGILSELSHMPYGLVLSLDLEKTDGTSDPDQTPDGKSAQQVVRGAFREVCSALRLFKAGAVGYEYIVPRPAMWTPYGSQSWQVWGGGPRSTPGHACELSQQEAAEFAEFWRSYRACLQDHRDVLEVALDRLNMAYADSAPGEKLIDYIIAFEALLLGDRQELAYKLALRGSRLLGENPDARQRAFEDLKAAYTARSDIVHGKQLRKVAVGATKNVPVGDLVKRVENHLRHAMKKQMVLLQGSAKGEKAPRKKQRIIDALDRDIARGC